VLVLKPGAEITEIAPAIATLMAKVCGFFLGNQRNAPRTVQTFSGKPTIDELTGRQLQILDFMADGLTNVEISRKLLLSESTIRQESVRIYRTLETDNRQDAVSKGRAAGLIAKLPIHEAAIAS
jgi:DNA-binding NarL/FixJ family response regulator